MSSAAAEKLRRSPWLTIALVGTLLYGLSYFALGEHQSGESALPRYTSHDRNFSFDPWVYIPLAKLECTARGLFGPDVQVVIDGSPGRDGSAIYIFWSGKPKF